MKVAGFAKLGASVATLIGSLALVLVPWVLAGSVSAAPDVVPVHVTLDDWSADPSPIHIPSDTVVVLTLDDVGRAWHEIVVPDLQLDLVSQPGASAATRLAPLPVGVHHWFCALPEHQAAGMQGWLVVGGTTGAGHQHTSV